MTPVTLGRIGAAGCAFALTAAMAIAQTAAPTRTFDAISIHPTATSGRICVGCMAPSRQSPTTMVLQGFTLRALVCLAYIDDRNSCGYRIASGGPGWSDSDRWEIEARTDMPASRPEKLQMLQRLLASRFQLVLRRETRETTAYALRLAGAAPKMPAATDLSQCGEFSTSDNQHFTAACVTLEDVSELIGTSFIEDRPVVNRTGVPDDRKYQLQLEAAAPDHPDAAAPSVFSALPDQLGLKLEADKASIEVLIMAAARRPDGN